MQVALALDPAPASYWNALGLVFGSASRFAEAEHAFREAAARDAKDAQYVYNIGLALQRQGRASEAVPFFRKTLDLDPRFAAARERLAELKTAP